MDINRHACPWCLGRAKISNNGCPIADAGGRIERLDIPLIPFIEIRKSPSVLHPPLRQDHTDWPSQGLAGASRVGKHRRDERGWRINWAWDWPPCVECVRLRPCECLEKRTDRILERGRVHFAHDTCLSEQENRQHIQRRPHPRGSEPFPVRLSCGFLPTAQRTRDAHGVDCAPYAMTDAYNLRFENVCATAVHF